MNIEKLRKKAGREEIDYQFLLPLLAKYAYPRDKISSWLKAGDLIRVKKGLYVFGKDAALHPYSKEVLANLIYGPSAMHKDKNLALGDLTNLLADKIKNTDFKSGIKDIAPFVNDRNSIDLWSKEFFAKIISKIRVAE